ncbi:hypothetical protein LCGC14_1562390, partial [marine sediment metagenome]
YSLMSAVALKFTFWVFWGYWRMWKKYAVKD